MYRIALAKAAKKKILKKNLKKEEEKGSNSSSQAVLVYRITPKRQSERKII